MNAALRRHLQKLPELNTENLRACQIGAITGIEHNLKAGRPRALLQIFEQRDENWEYIGTIAVIGNDEKYQAYAVFQKLDEKKRGEK